MEKLTLCPACSDKNIHFFKKIKDFSISKEEFHLDKCRNCGLVFTNPRPSKDEIGPYYESDEYISHSNSNKGLINKVYKIVRNIAIKNKTNLVKSLLEGEMPQIMDIGCGTGEFLAACQKENWKVVGVEPNEKAREQAKNEHKLTVYNETYLKNSSEKFNLITMWHVLEHVHQLQERIQELYQLLYEKGVLIVAVPNIDSNDAKHYGTYWAALDVPRHLYQFSPAVIKNLFEKHGFRHVKSMPMKFDAFYVAMLSEKYKGGGKQNLLKAFWQGLLSNIKTKNDAEKYSSVIYVFKK